MAAIPNMTYSPGQPMQDFFDIVNQVIDAVNAITANNTLAIKELSTTWNGDTTPFINVAHGLTLSKIVSFSFSVMNNAGTDKYTAGTFDTGTIALFEGLIDSANVQLIRTGSTIIDSAAWNAATVKIYIIYEK